MDSIHPVKTRWLLSRDNRLALLGVALCFLLLSTGWIRAHDPGLSTLEIGLHADTVQACMFLAISDAKLLYPMGPGNSPQLSQTEFDAAQLGLEEVALSMVVLSFDTNRSQPFQSTASFVPAENDIVLEVWFERKPAERLTVLSKAFEKLPRGHRQYLKWVDADGASLGERMLESAHPSHELNLADNASQAWHVSLLEFVKLGVEHIITGYDHLVFLFGLLIIGGRFKSIIATITAFTVAHSITLSVATLDWIRMPASIVEPLIALSIVYVGVENLIRRNPKQRWMPAFGFGLIHGLGFASLLGDLGIGSSGLGIVGPLLSFNLGVEIGQIALAAVAMPIIWKLNQTPAFQARWLPVCSILICLAGAYWLVQRTLL